MTNSTEKILHLIPIEDVQLQQDSNGSIVGASIVGESAKMLSLIMAEQKRIPVSVGYRCEVQTPSNPDGVSVIQFAGLSSASALLNQAD